MSSYDDIINLPRPISKKHKPMSLYNRAAQFAPYAALVGYDAVIKEVGRTTSEELYLNDDQAMDINSKLIYLKDNNDIEAIYTCFVKDCKKQGGAYVELRGKIKKIDLDRGQIILNTGDKVIINNIVKVDI